MGRKRAIEQTLCCVGVDVGLIGLGVAWTPCTRSATTTQPTTQPITTRIAPCYMHATGLLRTIELSTPDWPRSAAPSTALSLHAMYHSTQSLNSPLCPRGARNSTEWEAMNPTPKAQVHLRCLDPAPTPSYTKQVGHSCVPWSLPLRSIVRPWSAWGHNLRHDSAHAQRPVQHEAKATVVETSPTRPSKPTRSTATLSRCPHSLLCWSQS